MRITTLDGLFLCFLSLCWGVIIAMYLTVDVPDEGGFTRQQAQALRELVARSKTKAEWEASLYHPKTEAERDAVIADVYEGK